MIFTLANDDIYRGLYINCLLFSEKYYISGDKLEMKCKLRELRETDLKYMMEWMHDPIISKNFRSETISQSETEVLKYINNSKYEIVDGASIHYAVVDERDIYLGTISLKNINLLHNNAEYAIVLRRCAQRKGIGTVATYLILEKAFKELGLEYVYLNVLTDNFHAIKFYERMGFRFDGITKNYFKIDGRLHDVKWYKYFKNDFNMVVY